MNKNIEYITESEENEDMDDMITVSSELIEQAELAIKLEALVADIKATTYSPFSNEEMKIKFIKKAIEKAGF
jgi:hypothetical protein